MALRGERLLDERERLPAYLLAIEMFGTLLIIYLWKLHSSSKRAARSIPNAHQSRSVVGPSMGCLRSNIGDETRRGGRDR